MSNKIKIQPEFDTKLKKLRIKTKFMNNFGKWRGRPHKQTKMFWRKECLSTFYWEAFIERAFSWSFSPEGFDFWYNISNK